MQRMFEDLVESTARPRTASARAVPVSIAIHGFVAASLLAIPLMKADDMPGTTVFETPLTLASVVPEPQPPPSTMRVEVRHESQGGHSVRPPDPDRLPPSAPGPAVDPTRLGAGDPEPDAPAPCLFNCGDGRGGGTGDGVLDPAGDPNGAGTGSGAPIRPGPEVKAPKKVKHVDPVYPELAIHARVGGMVILECIIDVDGKVVDVKVLRGHPLLDRAAVAAVSQWRYTPTLLRGVPVSVVMTVTVTFTPK